MECKYYKELIVLRREFTELQEDRDQTIADQKKRIAELELLIKGHKATNNQLVCDHRADVKLIAKIKGENIKLKIPTSANSDKEKI